MLRQNYELTMFGTITSFFGKIKETFTNKIAAIFGRQRLSAEDIAEIRRLLLLADVGTKKTAEITKRLESYHGELSGEQAHQIVQTTLLQSFDTITFGGLNPVIMLVGINGSGKTTSVAKLAHLLQSQGKRVLVAAADTYRAAAVDQLAQLAARENIPVVSGAANSDPAAVVFQACKRYTDEKFDYLIIDTAGRLQTKTHLMKELEKIRRVVGKSLPNESALTTLLTVDSMLGQNSFEQARLFHESTPLSGVILTKMDGTAKGGVVFSIVEELKIPVAYICYGERVEHIAPFEAHAYVSTLLSGYEARP